MGDVVGPTIGLINTSIKSRFLHLRGFESVEISRTRQVIGTSPFFYHFCMCAAIFPFTLVAALRQPPPNPRPTSRTYQEGWRESRCKQDGRSQAIEVVGALCTKTPRMIKLKTVPTKMMSLLPQLLASLESHYIRPYYRCRKSRYENIPTMSQHSAMYPLQDGKHKSRLLRACSGRKY